VSHPLFDKLRNAINEVLNLGLSESSITGCTIHLLKKDMMGPMQCSASHLRFTCNAVEDWHMHWGRVGEC